jgi:CheY-specific phosphatase CheX
MSNYNIFYKCIVRSVSHIFKHFFKDDLIDEVFNAQASKEDPVVCVELTGALKGEIIINLPVKTLNMLIRQLIPDVKPQAIKKHHADVAGELANLITGTFANQLQYINYNVRLSAPDYNEDPITIKALYDNINVSFLSSFGGFDVDLYYKEAN